MEVYECIICHFGGTWNIFISGMLVGSSKVGQLNEKFDTHLYRSFIKRCFKATSE